VGVDVAVPHRGEQIYDDSLILEIRWRVYNIAFKLFGKTKQWPALARITWG